MNTFTLGLCWGIVLGVPVGAGTSVVIMTVLQ